jgi:hypothetical protein
MIPQPLCGAVPSPLDRVDQLARIAEALERGEAPAPADAAAFVAGWAIYVRDAALGVTLEDALGMSPTAPGEEHWTTIQRRQRRNTAIRAIRSAPLFADLKISEAAREIAGLACRYRQKGRAIKQDPPLAIDPETEQLLTEAFCTGLPFPGAKQITNILGNLI